MEPKFVDWPERTFVGVGGRFVSVMAPEGTNFKVIPALWHDYQQRLAEIAGRRGEDAPGGWRAFGLVEQLPAEEKKHPMEMFYIAAAEVEAGSPPPKGMEKRVVEAGRWALFTHKGKLDKLGETMGFIFKQWLPTSGLKMRKGPQVEVYDGRFKMGEDGSEMDILIPVDM